MKCDKFSVKFEGKSYDLKRFMRDHPGGVNMLKVYEGKSIKKAMAKFGHSTSAYHMLNDFKVETREELDSNLTGKLSGNGRIITNEEQHRGDGEIAFMEELESRLDWSQPILNQLDALTPHYDKWVNTAVYRKCRLFANPVLEAMSITPWYLVPMFWMPIITYLGVSQYFENVYCGDSCPVEPLSKLQYAFHLAQGLLLWSVMEYSLHRWVFHLDPGTSPTMVKIHFIIHGLHHKVPFDSYRHVIPPIPAFLLASFLYFCLRPFMTYPLMKMAGILVGYLTYDMIHYYVHHGSPKDGSYLYAMKRYHSTHHFENHHKAFGVSSKMWDYIFLTIASVKKLNCSLHWNL